MDTRNLDHQRARAQRLRSEIIQALGSENDHQAIADAIEGQTEFNETVLILAREAKRREAMAGAMKPIIADNNYRQMCHERAAESIRRAIGAAMVDLDLKNVHGPDVTVSTRLSAPGVRIESEQMLPAWAWKTSTFRTPNLEAIKARAENEIVPGVVRPNPVPVVTIRTI
jgi:hypothetical protein